MPVALTAPQPPPHTYVRPQVHEIPRRLEAVTPDSFGVLYAEPARVSARLARRERLPFASLRPILVSIWGP